MGTHPATLRWPTTLSLRDKEVKCKFNPLFAACGREGCRAKQDRVSQSLPVCQFPNFHRFNGFFNIMYPQNVSAFGKRDDV